VVTNACAFYFCARGCGCNGHPAFPTPSLGGSFMHNSGAIRAAGRLPAVIISESGRPSIPRRQ
jgi:hypothetical protein